jgi:hypothetical protein
MTATPESTGRKVAETSQNRLGTVPAIGSIIMTTSKITSLDSLPETISADTEVCIPGYYLEKCEDVPGLWMLTDLVTDIPTREVRVVD